MTLAFIKQINEYVIEATITLDAFKELGITRLGARIFELRQEGHPVQSNRLTVTNRFGEDCSISEYYIGKQSNG